MLSYLIIMASVFAHFRTLSAESGVQEVHLGLNKQQMYSPFFLSFSLWLPFSFSSLLGEVIGSFVLLLFYCYCFPFLFPTPTARRNNLGVTLIEYPRCSCCCYAAAAFFFVVVLAFLLSLNFQFEGVSYCVVVLVPKTKDT